MSLPMTAVGPLKVETNPILMESPAAAGPASARAIAPASQTAVLIFISPPVYSDYLASRGDGPVLGHVFCARTIRPAASTNPRRCHRTFGSVRVPLHHNSWL